MKRRTFTLGLAGLGLGACSGFGGPRRFVLTERELQERIERSFPIDKRVLTAFDLRMAAPRLKLLPARNRVGAELAVDVKERFYGAEWRGRLDFDSALHLAPADGALSLREVRVGSFDLRAGDGGLDPQLQRLGAGLAEQMLEGLVVWRPDAARLEQLRALGLQAGPVQVTEQGITIDLVPAR